MSVPLPFANKPVSISFNATYEDGAGWRLICTRRMAWERWDDSAPLELRRLADNEIADALCIVAGKWLEDT